MVRRFLVTPAETPAERTGTMWRLRRTDARRGAKSFLAPQARVRLTTGVESRTIPTVRRTFARVQRHQRPSRDRRDGDRHRGGVRRNLEGVVLTYRLLAVGATAGTLAGATDRRGTLPATTVSDPVRSSRARGCGSAYDVVGAPTLADHAAGLGLARRTGRLAGAPVGPGACDALAGPRRRRGVWASIFSCYALAFRARVPSCRSFRHSCWWCSPTVARPVRPADLRRRLPRGSACRVVRRLPATDRVVGADLGADWDGPRSPVAGDLAKRRARRAHGVGGRARRADCGPGFGGRLGFICTRSTAMDGSRSPRSRRSGPS